MTAVNNGSIQSKGDRYTTIKIKETTIKVVNSKVVSIEPNAPNKSAKIPPKPVICVVRLFGENSSFRSSLMNSTRIDKIGFSSMLSVATSDRREIFAKIALPSSDGIACIGRPSIK